MNTPPPHGRGPKSPNYPLADPDRAVHALARWFAQTGRDLPWRSPGLRTGKAVRARRGDTHDHAWGVLVSEVMLQQTPVDRVISPWREWMARWPTPAALAGCPAGDAIRAWGRLGYPRRALRLHAAASAITERHGGRVPRTYDALIALPGVGEYTAGAVLAFAYGIPALTLDTNVRRVLHRYLDGREGSANAVTADERAAARRLLPESGGAHAMAALMELGATVCTARAPRCKECPLATGCRWLALGQPEGPRPRRQAAYAGSDRQARGALLAVLRAAEGTVSEKDLASAWPVDVQRARAWDSLLEDGLVVPTGRGRWRLP